MKYFNILLILSFNIICFSQNKVEYVPRQLIVKVKQDLFVNCKNYSETKNKKTRKALLKAIDKDFKNIGIYRIDKLHIMNKFLSKDAERSFVIYFNDKEDIYSIINKLKTTDKIEAVTPNYIFRATTVEPNDTKYDKQWSLRKIGMPEAWEIQKGCKSIKVAVLDVGFRKREHNDIKNKYTDIRRDETDIDISSYLSDGYKKIVGEDYDTPDNLPYSKSYHGQQVAGVVGAETNNNKGLASVGWNIDILPVRCGFYIKKHISGIQYEKVGIFEYDDEIRAIDWVVANGKAQVINMSFGGQVQSNEELIAYNESLSAANNAGIVLIAASGNQELGDDVAFPASHPLVIAVGATTQNDVKSPMSCFGNNLDLVAPGYLMKVLYKKIGLINYTIESGTSLSAPLVSAAAALILSQNPELTPEQVRQILIESADKVAGMNGQNFHEYYGYGRLNVHKALQFVPAVKYNHVLENEVITDYRQVQAIQTITAGNGYIIKSGAEVIFKAGEEIILNPGFETEEGADFTAYIGNVNVNECIPDCPDITVEAYPNIISNNLCYNTENADYFEITVNNNIGQNVFNNSGNIPNNNICVWDASLFAEGNYQVTIIFKNECGNVSENTYTVTKVNAGKNINNNIITNTVPFHFDIIPNPANERAEIYLTVKKEMNLNIFIRDITGRKIKTIANFINTEKGDYNIPVNFSDMQQGIYFIVIKSPETVRTKKIIHSK